MEIQSEIKKTYGEKLRVRVCGICIKADEILLVKHKHLNQSGTLWAPPGGGMEYGESAKRALVREFKEETGLDINVKDFLFVHEYLDEPLHGIELFFTVEITGGELELGKDPEFNHTTQLLSDVSFQNLKNLQLAENESLHYVLQSIKDLETLINQKRLFQISLIKLKIAVRNAVNT